jgi:hypothetical protein
MVVRVHIAFKRAYAMLARHLGQPIEQRGAKPLALERVFDDDCDLSDIAPLGIAHAAADRNDAAVQITDQREVILIIDIEQPLHARGLDMWEMEEAMLQALRRKMPAKLAQALAVIGTQRPQRHDRTIAKHGVEAVALHTLANGCQGGDTHEFTFDKDAPFAITQG